MNRSLLESPRPTMATVWACKDAFPVAEARKPGDGNPATGTCEEIGGRELRRDV